MGGGREDVNDNEAMLCLLLAEACVHFLSCPLSLSFLAFLSLFFFTLSRFILSASCSPTLPSVLSPSPLVLRLLRLYASPSGVRGAAS